MATSQFLQRLSIIRIAILMSAIAGPTTTSGGTLPDAAEPTETDVGVGPAKAAVADSEPTGVINLPRILALTLTQSPELQSFSWQIRADEARMLQAGLLPNPSGELVVEDVLGTGRFRGGREAQVTLQLGQLIELGGKRAARTDVASRSRDVARGDYEMKRVDVLADATERFITVLEGQDALALARTNAELSQATVRTVERRVRVGAGSTLESKKAQIALARARVAEEDAAHELAIARTRLAAAWGSSTPSFERADGDLSARRHVPTFAALAGRIATSPEILRWVSERNLRQAEVGLANAKRIPDLSLSAGPRRHEGPDDFAFVFGVGVPLPLFDRNQGGVAEARALAGKTDAAARATEVRLRAVLFGLHQALLHAGHEIDALEKHILPDAQEALSISRQGFTEGRFSLLELLDTQRTFVDVKMEYLAAAARYHRFVLTIERLTGEAIDRTSAAPETAPEHPDTP
jgi:cobalt-zinc-cadmium efflux system outer membrane protein